jgi:uncharacterized delta-60 repeat protein
MLRICSRLRHKRAFNFSLTPFCLLLMLQLLLIACGGSGGGSDSGNGDPLGDMDGTWNGTWVSRVTSGLDGSFEARVVQSGSSLSGRIDIPFIGMDDATLTGTVSGSQITFGDIDHTITFVGSVNGDQCSGTFSLPAYNESGTWTADRTDGGGGTTAGLDADFGTSGVVVTDLHLTPAAMAVQSTGRILIAGDPMSDLSIDVVQIVALTSNGQLDAAFGSEAVATTTATPVGADRVCGMALAEDDTIYLCTQAGEDGLVLLSYTTDGEPDTDFGSDGQVTVGLDSGETLSAMTRSVDGSLLVAGMASGSVTVRRFLWDGSVDTGFGTNGKVRVSVDGLERVADLAADAGESILVAGTADSDLFIMALTHIGAVDTTWASGGMTTFDQDSADQARDMAILPDGRIVVAAFGEIDFMLPKTAFMAVHRSDGVIEDPFGTQGVCGVSDLDNGIAPVLGSYLQMAVDSRDRLIMAGMDTNQFLLVRYGSEGQIDTSFGSSGFESADFGSTGGWDFATAVTVQADDGIVVAGVAGSSKLVAARYTP